MKKSIWLAILSFSALFTLTKCVEPFELPASATDADLLVVEGYVDVENQLGRVTLSRTQKLNDEGSPRREVRAKVTLETEQNETIPMQEGWNGVYFAYMLPLEYGKPYRLRIKTANGEEYLSEFVHAYKTPEIDSLTWQVEQGGVKINVNTHDPTNSTRYYRWDFEETYEYTSYFNSLWEYVNGEVVLRSKEDQIYRCWRTDPSTAILVGTTTQLAQDIVRDFPVVFRGGDSEKLAIKYSILVKQYGISKAEYEYWQMLKKNTENVGSIFDAQPSQVRGNFKNVTKPEVPVLGYFSVKSSTSKRIFITGKEMKDRGIIYHNIPVCNTDTATVSELPKWLSAGRNIAAEIGQPGTTYVVAGPSCTDCRTKGGTTVKPGYWE